MDAHLGSTPGTTPPSRRRGIPHLDALGTAAIAAVAMIGLLLLALQSRPGGIGSLVGRYGGMSSGEERLAALVQAATDKALAGVVLQLDREPAGAEPLTFPSDLPWGHVPDFTLFDDGRVVYLDDSLPYAPIPMSVQLDAPAAQQIVEQVVALGFDRLQSQESPTKMVEATRYGWPVAVPAAGYEILRLRRDDGLRSLRIYDDAARTSDPEAFGAIVAALRDWSSPDADVFAPDVAVMFRTDDLDTDASMFATALQSLIAPISGVHDRAALDWPTDLPYPPGFPTVVDRATLDALRARMPSLDADLASVRVDGEAVAELRDLQDPAVAGDAVLVDRVQRSAFWGWTFRFFREDYTEELLLVGVPWVYAGRYPDLVADVAAVDEARRAVRGERIAARATESARVAMAPQDYPPALPTWQADLAAIGEEPETVFPFPPQVRPAPLELALGIQVWSHWMTDAHRLLRVKQSTAPRFAWLKQRFAWTDIEPTGSGEFDYNEMLAHPDEWFQVAESWDATHPPSRILVQLDVPPPWARRDGEVPFDLEAWERFVHQFAVRYAGEAHAYEILNEPNLAREWGAAPSPEGYAKVLAAAYRAIKTADPLAVVISAGLAPTGTNLPEAMGDDEFLRRLYDAMDAAGGSDLYFDALGAHAPGFKAAPEVSPVEAETTPALGGQRYFTFRRVEDLRTIMVERGDEAKQIVITEFGWTVDSRPDSPYHWFAVSEQQRAERIRAAYEFGMGKWSAWLGPMIVFTAGDPAWTPDHEAWWWSVTQPDGSIKPAISSAFADLGEWSP